jgi:hypothetical protein
LRIGCQEHSEKDLIVKKFTRKEIEEEWYSILVSETIRFEAWEKINQLKGYKYPLHFFISYQFHFMDLEDEEIFAIDPLVYKVQMQKKNDEYREKMRYKKWLKEAKLSMLGVIWKSD